MSVNCLGEVIFERRYSQDERGIPTYTKVYKFELTDGREGPAAFTAAMPYIIGSAYDNKSHDADDLMSGDGVYETDPAIVCRGIDTVGVSDDGLTVMLSFTFRYPEWIEQSIQQSVNFMPEPGDYFPAADPVDWRAKVGWFYENEERTASRAFDSYNTAGEPTYVPIVNSAGDWFQPAPTFTSSKVVISVDVNVSKSDLDLADVLDLKNSVNDYPVTIRGLTFDTYDLLLRDVRVNEEFHPQHAENSGYYYGVHIEILVDLTEQHKLYLLDQGFYSLNGTARTPILIEGEPTADPKPLDGDGGVLASDADPVFLEFRVNLPKNWSILPLPAS
jgi:hypothetical protein